MQLAECYDSDLGIEKNTHMKSANPKQPPKIDGKMLPFPELYVMQA